MNEGPPNGLDDCTDVQRDLLAQTISNHMRGGGAVDKDAWNRFESFVSEKARQFRSEQLKRGHGDTAMGQPGSGVEDKANQNGNERRILKVRRRV